MKRSREIYILIGILVLGALIRALYLTEITNNLDFYSPGVDALYHDYWARSLATGNWTPPGLSDDPQIRTTPFFRPPGYPYFLALIYLLSGSSYLAARIVQMLLGLVGVLLAFMLGRRWFGSRVGLIFAAFMSVYWTFIYFEGELLEPVLLVPLSLLLVYELGLWTEKITFRRSLLTGVILGLFALVRPNILLFAPVALVWAFWILRARGDTRPLKAAVLGLALGCALMIAPATIRNYIAARDFVPISSNGGINLYIGNNPAANGRVAGVIPGVGKFETCFDYPQLVRNLERKLGRPLKHSEVSEYFSREAAAYVRSHPGDALRLTGLRALLFWGPKEVGHNKEDELERMNSRVLRNIPGNFAAALSLALIGTALLILDARRRKKTKGSAVEARTQYEVFVLVVLLVVVYFASYLPFFVAGRYRAPVVPFLLLLGAYGVERILSFAACRDYVKVALSLVLLVGGFALASVNFSGYQPDLAAWHYMRGVDFNNFGKTERAIQEYTEALRVKPDYPPANVNLGLILAEQGKADESVGHFQRVLEVTPDNAWAHYGMGLVLAQKGDLRVAIRELREAVRLDPSQFMAHCRLGVIYLSLGNVKQAEVEFSDSLKINPRVPLAHAGLAMVLEGQGKFDEAIEHYSQSLKLNPDAYLHSKLANLYVRQGKIAEAAAEFEAAVRLDPRDSSSEYNLAVAYERLGKLDDAIEHYVKAVEIQPDLAKAHKNLAVAYYYKARYADAWNEVRLCRKYGGTPHPQFVKALSQKMPEPR